MSAVGPAPVRTRTLPERAAGRARRERAVVCGALVLGAGALLGVLTQPWAEVAVVRAAPLPNLHETIDGRSLAPALGGAALVALAGAVALLATSGWARRVVGLLLAATGLGAAVAAARLVNGPSDARARELIVDRTSGVGVGRGFPVGVSSHPGWVVAAVALGLIIALAGVAAIVRGSQWSAMSARYEAPSGATGGPSRAVRNSTGAQEAPSDLALWTALDRGDDPTRGD